MKRIVLLLGIFLIASMLFACAPKVALLEEPQPLAITEPLAGQKETWKLEWERTLNAARKEGRVVVYATTTAPALKEAASLIKQKYGIDLDVIGGRGSELSNKLLSERSNRLFIVDVLIAGMNSNIGVKWDGALDPLEPTLILPEVIDPKAWVGGELPWGDNEHTLFRYYAYPSSPLGINTELVKPAEIKSYYDLLAPKFKSKIVINDPTVAGSGANSFNTPVYHKALELDYFRQLIQQQPVLTRDQRLQVDWVARGKYSVALWPDTQPITEYKVAGAPIDFITTIKEGTQITPGGGVVSLVNRAPHPNAAKVFINWLLSREGQTYMQNTHQNQSARVDISVEGVDPQKIRKPGEKYLVAANTIEEWLINEQTKYFELAKQTFAPLLK